MLYIYIICIGFRSILITIARYIYVQGDPRNHDYCDTCGNMGDLVPPPLSLSFSLSLSLSLSLPPSLPLSLSPCVCVCVCVCINLECPNPEKPGMP